jgi:SRSO17 transposase
MTDEQIRDLGPAFSAYLRPNFSFCNQGRTFSHLDAYCRALLTEAPRKTAEPNALASGTAVRTLQKFLTTTHWDHLGVRDKFQTRIARKLEEVPSDDGLGTVGVIDETSSTKKGDKTPGVQRQYLGCVGKIDNGIVTVHLAVTRGSFRTLLDGDLYLPTSWDEDRKRCENAGIPSEIKYRAKWQIALEQYFRAANNGVGFDWLTFDEGYGSKPLFVSALAIVKQKFAGEIPKSFAVDGRGGSSIRADVVLPESKAKKENSYRLKRETKPDQIWQATGKDVMVDGLPMTLVVARNEATKEVKYFLAWGTTSVRKVLRVGFRRWTVEHLFRVAKQEVGLMDYEGRKYIGLMRHLILSMLVLGFVSIQTDRLREKKSGVDDGTSEPCIEPTLHGVIDPPTWRFGPRKSGPGDSISSSEKRYGKIDLQKAAA